MGDPILILSSFVCFCLLLVLFRFLDRFWWTPVYIQYRLGSQGIKGPSYKFIHGNTREMLKMVLPHVYTWMNNYGKNHLSWRGGEPQLLITEPELIKEVLNNRDGLYLKASLPFYFMKLMGNGLATSEGEQWVKHQKLINPAFQGENLEKMIPEMIVSVELMLQSWKKYQAKEIEVSEEFRLLATDIISRTAFGSNYLEGKTIFDMMTQYSNIIRRNIFKPRFPGLREEKVKLGDIDCYAYHDVDENKRILVQDLIDECKTFYIAGQETINSLLSWTVLLLAIHTDWQDKAREEVIELFGHQNPHPNDLSKLHTISRIINEALRLYPPTVAFISRSEREVRLGKFILPANIQLFISNLVVHRDPGIWGDDAHLFKPERFSGEVAKATSNNVAAYFPFGIGPRTCVGFNFATVGAKIVLIMILQRYRFTFSPTYVHSPVINFLLVPQHGIQVILHSLQSDEGPS
ncbi:hypothetical protein ES332_D13G101600v1 [Gossypium tomentosum]|uniref:Cytochrome P450 n=1 Tax=Gossypium tomentosum TaxID=34277 RepID=A0A5D2HV53_GOSTO|nr:hypothetical protein ES332_D13G101600v1 [Gossypium tomentosum]